MSAAHQLYLEATQLHLWVQAMTRGESYASSFLSSMLALTNAADCGMIHDKDELIELSRHQH